MKWLLSLWVMDEKARNDLKILVRNGFRKRQLWAMANWLVNALTTFWEEMKKRSHFQVFRSLFPRQGKRKIWL